MVESITGRLFDSGDDLRVVVLEQMSLIQRMMSRITTTHVEYKVGSKRLAECVIFGRRKGDNLIPCEVG